jgi:hypothetical protein
MSDTNQGGKWDWNLIEQLLMDGKTVREIQEMDEFGGRGMSLGYLKNQVSRRKLLVKRDEIIVKAKAAITQTLQEKRKSGVEEHHLFVFESLDRMRSAILQHKVTGSVKELREMIDLLQKYIDAASEGYGLKGEQTSGPAVNLNAMVALHIAPPSKAANVIEIVQSGEG